jgi:hypothetical protein
MKSRLRWVSLGLAVLLVGLQSMAMAQEKGYSHVRIVRLSFVDGTVLVKRPNSTGWAKALVNTPIQQGFAISTSTGSYAETQFENGSTARLGESSRINFTELALAPSGAKVNRLAFDQGYATFHFVPGHGDVYAVEAGNAAITPKGKSEFRVDVQQGTVRVEVLDGSVEVKSPQGAAKLGKGKVLEYNPKTQEALNVTNGIQQDAWDKWVHERDQQTTLALSDSAVAMNSPVYGWSDLDQYGEWGFFPGFGYGWSPFAPAGWSPFSVGQWSSYPGWGYTWISGEPWGWLPFHYGFWNYDPSFGYFWMPGGGFNTFYPGMVEWLGGPGYIGWVPVGTNGAPVCRTSRCITAVKPGTLTNGRLVTAATRVAVNPSQLRILGTASLPAPSPAAAQNGFVTRSLEASSAAAATAPKILLMGQTPAQSAAEAKALTAHRSFFSRAFGANRGAALQARLGNTLGGHFPVTGEARGAGFRPAERGRMANEGPMFLPHAHAMGHATARMSEGGGVRAESRGGGYSASGGMAPAAPGGYSGASSAPAAHGSSSPGAVRH